MLCTGYWQCSSRTATQAASSPCAVVGVVVTAGNTHRRESLCRLCRVCKRNTCSQVVLTPRLPSLPGPYGAADQRKLEDMIGAAMEKAEVKP